MNETRQRKEVQERLELHQAFWNREPVERAIVGEALQDSIFPLENLAESLTEGVICAADIRPETWVPSGPVNGPMQLGGDLFHVEWAFPALPWTEAIAGCPVHIAVESGTTWAEPIVDSIGSLSSVHPEIQSDWIEKLLECTQVLVSRGKGDYFVSTTLMRGPLDMLVAMINTEQVLLAFYEEPDEVQRLLDFCTDTWIEVAKAQLACIPPTHGGHFNRYKVWAPGTSVVTQADASMLLSPRMYAEFLLPCDARIAEAFDYVTMHSHSAGQTQLDLWLSLDELSCIEVALDPVGPSLEEMLPLFERILARKPLILMGTNAEETATATERLPATGFCVIPRY